jgi:flagellar biosynthesis/type III secretory pathway M-ring protein FliF/YscJ
MTELPEKENSNLVGLLAGTDSPDSKLSEKEKGRLISEQLKKVATENPEQLAKIIKAWLAEGK